MLSVQLMVNCCYTQLDWNGKTSRTAGQTVHQQICFSAMQYTGLRLPAFQDTSVPGEFINVAIKDKPRTLATIYCEH